MLLELVVRLQKPAVPYLPPCLIQQANRLCLLASLLQKAPEIGGSQKTITRSERSLVRRKPGEQRTVEWGGEVESIRDPLPRATEQGTGRSTALRTRGCWLREHLLLVASTRTLGEFFLSKATFDICGKAVALQESTPFPSRVMAQTASVILR